VSEEIKLAFRTLGLESDASAQAIKEAYRDLVKVWHPDRFASDARLQAKAQEKLTQINSALEKLRAANLLEVIPERSGLHETPRAKSSKQNTNQEANSDSVSVSKVFDKQSNLYRYIKRVPLVTGFDGRWRGELNKEYVTRPVPENVSYETASADSLSFKLSSLEGKRGIHRDYASRLDPSSRIYGTKDDYLFDDGSWLAIESVRVDTLSEDKAAQERWNDGQKSEAPGHSKSAPPPPRPRTKNSTGASSISNHHKWAIVISILIISLFLLIFGTSFQPDSQQTKDLPRPQTTPKHLTKEQIIAELRAKGLNPDDYDLDALVADSVDRVSDSGTLPANVHYMITVTMPNGQQMFYFSEKEPKPYGNGYKFKMYGTEVEMTVSGNVKIMRVK
jgi:curved DNA-binding protein CbpA